MHMATSHLSILMVLASCAAQLTAGENHFVAEAGDDSAAGSRAQPWGSIQHAIDQIGPGDTVTVMAGSYREKLEFNSS